MWLNMLKLVPLTNCVALKIIKNPAGFLLSNLTWCSKPTVHPAGLLHRKAMLQLLDLISNFSNLWTFVFRRINRRLLCHCNVSIWSVWCFSRFRASVVKYNHLAGSFSSCSGALCETFSAAWPLKSRAQTWDKLRYPTSMEHFTRV